MTTEKPTSQDGAGGSPHQDPFSVTPLTPTQMVEMRADALRKTVRHLLPHLRGAFLVGTSVSASRHEWSSFQLTTNDADNLMLAVMVPSAMCHWVRPALLGHVDTGTISAANSRGNPKNDDEMCRAVRSAAAEIHEFFERWILIGHFVTEFDCLEPMVYAHRLAGEDLVDFLRPAIFAMDYACSTFLERFGFKRTKTIMELAHEHVEDIVNLYPDPKPEDAAEYLRRLLLDQTPLDPEELISKTKWLPGLGDIPTPPTQEG